MTFRRVLVMVMAVIMMVSACATSVLAAYRPETKHEHLDDVLNDPELIAKYEEIKATVEYVAKDIEENHEEYYANGYAYALENGYIGTAIEVIEVMLEVLPTVELEGVEMTEEFREDLEAELDALVPTLEKLLAILESGEASEFDGFVEAALTLEGDLYTHLNNIYAILEQASIDLNQFILVPAFYEALRVLEEEVIPVLEAAINAYVDAVVDYVVEALTPYYNAVVKAIGIAKDTYELLVETIVKIDLYVTGAIDAVVNAYNALIETLINIYGTVENAIETVEDFIKTACSLYNDIIDTVVELNSKVENTIENVENFIICVTDTYRNTVKFLVGVYGEVKNAVIVAGQIYDYIVGLIIDGKVVLENASELAAKIYVDVVEIVKAAYAEKDDVYYVATKIGEYVVNAVYELCNFVEDTFEGAVEGDYELTDDSHYVSIGNAGYAEALAGKLNLAEKHTVVTFGGNYIEALTNADLVTVKLDNGSFMSLAEAQIEGKIAEIIRSNNDIMAWYDGIDSLIETLSSNPWIPEEYKTNIVNGLTQTKDTIDSTIDLSATTVELDWDKYLNAEGKAALDSLLAKVREEALNQGLEENYYLDINPMINDILVQNGLGGIFTLSFAPIVIPQADLVVFAVENMIYGYAEFIGNIASVLANSDATIVLTPVNNPLVGYKFKGIDLGEYAEVVDPVVDVLNAHLYVVALTNEDVIFVNSEDADDIYDALNVRCDHIHDDCEDTLCNRCLATIEPLGHIFNNYVSDNNGTCKKDCTETAKCERCGKADTRAIPNSKGDHVFEPATCTAPSTCKECGATQGEPTDHVLGDWRVTKDPTSNSEGMRERKCLYCDYRETEVIPYDSLSTIAIVGIIVACVAVIGGASALVAGILRKKNKI